MHGRKGRWKWWKDSIESINGGRHIYPAANSQCSLLTPELILNSSNQHRGKGDIYVLCSVRQAENFAVPCFTFMVSYGASGDNVNSLGVAIFMTRYMSFYAWGWSSSLLHNNQLKRYFFPQNKIRIYDISCFEKRHQIILDVCRECLCMFSPSWNNGYLI